MNPTKPLDFKPSDFKPLKRQLEFLKWEFGIFFHFGVRTFHEGHKDWDMKPMSLDNFNPTELDCDNWLSTAKNAGAKYAILVTKHHDGFANWQSKYTDYHIGNTPWKDGKGDLVAEFVASCRKYDIKCGLYYSPSDFAMKQSQKPQKEYDDYFINQIGELLTNYGKIDYLWFDGCGSDGEWDKERIIKHIRSLQSDIIIFNMWDPDTCWMGNEAGIMPKAGYITDISKLSPPASKKTEYRWLPTECDCMIRDNTWFYTDSEKSVPMSLERLLGIYYYSVGRGANLLVNIGPDRRGLLPDVDVMRIMEFGNEIKRRFSNPIVTLDSFKQNGNKFICKLEKPTDINHVVLAENLSEGNLVSKFSIKCNLLGSIIPIELYQGNVIGSKSICVFPTIRAEELIIEVEEGEQGYNLTKIDVFNVDRRL